MVAKRSKWSKLGKYVSAAVIVCFFLPFFGISCDGMDVITISGADMVGGCKPGGLITAAEEDGKVEGGSIETKIDNVAVEPFAIGALALVVIMFGLSFVASRNALRSTLIVAVLAIGMLVALYVKMRGDMMEAVEKESASMANSTMTKDVDVSAGGRFGLWLAGIGLLSVIGMTASAMRKKPEATPEVVPPPDAMPPTV
jgi:hypothetical protein